MKKLHYLKLLLFLAIIITSCAVESEHIVNLPKIDGYEIKNIYRLNSNLMAAYINSSGHRLFFKLNENSESWKRIMFKTKVYYKHQR